MTVIELLDYDVQKIRGIRLPIAEHLAASALAEIANEIEACIQTLADGVAAEAEEKAQAENEDSARAESFGEEQRVGEESAEDLFGEKEVGLSKDNSDEKAGEDK